MIEHSANRQMNYLLRLYRPRWFTPQRNWTNSRKLLLRDAQVTSPRTRTSWGCWVKSKPTFREFHFSVNLPAEAAAFSIRALGGTPWNLLLLLRGREETGPEDLEQDVGATIRRRYATPLKRYRLHHRFRLITQGRSPASAVLMVAFTLTCPAAADDSIPAGLGKRTGRIIKELVPKMSLLKPNNVMQSGVARFYVWCWATLWPGDIDMSRHW